MSLELYHKNATSRGHGSLISELWCTPQGCYLSVNNRKHQVTYKSLSFIYERLLWKQWSQMQHLTHMIQTLRSQILTSPSWLVASTWRFTLFHLTCEAPTKITNKNKILIIFRAVINGHNPWDLLWMGSHLMLRVIKVESLRWHCKFLWDVMGESLLATEA